MDDDRVKELVSKSSTLLLLSSEGKNVLDLDRSSITNPVFIIDWSGESRSLSTRNAIRVAPPLKTGALRYDAVSALYALLRYVMGIAPNDSCRCEKGCVGIDIRKLIYVSKKVIESMHYLDRCWVVEPHALIAVFNKVARSRGLIAEMSYALVEETLDSCRQRVFVDVFDAKNIDFVGRVTVELDGCTLRIDCDEVVARRLSDTLCGACLCMDPASKSVEICGSRMDLSMESVDYGLVRLLGI